MRVRKSIFATYVVIGVPDPNHPGCERAAIEISSNGEHLPFPSKFVHQHCGGGVEV